ncbi:unnamed protein product, partial [Ostreobium quekettii]
MSGGGNGPPAGPSAVGALRLSEEEILRRAVALRRDRELVRGGPPKEPDRNFTHWDQLLQEMRWMADDFSRERKWKVSQGKLFARRCSRAKLDAAAKQQQREREEEQRKRRKCAWVAKEVMRFWRKAERVVAFKTHLAVEKRRKELMDKHLDFFLGQTERYTSMVAQNLTGASEGHSQGEPSTSQPSQTNQTATKPGVDNPLLGAAKFGAQKRCPNGVLKRVAFADENQEELRANKKARTGDPADGDPAQQFECSPAVKLPPEIDASTAGGMLPSRESSPVSRSPVGDGTPGKPLDRGAQSVHLTELDQQIQTADSSDDHDDDYDASNVHEDLDEATLQEEERRAAAEGGVSQQQELDTLKEEADLPLEALLQKYKLSVTGDCRLENVRSSSQLADGGDESDEDVASDTREVGDAGRKEVTEPVKNQLGEKGRALHRQGLRPSKNGKKATVGSHMVHALPGLLSLQDSYGEQRSKDARPEQEKGLVQTLLSGETKDEEGGHSPSGELATDLAVSISRVGPTEADDADDYATSNDGEDDEATLEEQEQFEGVASGHHKQELTELNKEAEIPLDELLKRYGVGVSNDCTIEPIRGSPGEPQEQEDASAVGNALPVSVTVTVPVPVTVEEDNKPSARGPDTFSEAAGARDGGPNERDDLDGVASKEAAESHNRNSSSQCDIEAGKHGKGLVMTEHSAAAETTARGGDASPQNRHGSPSAEVLADASAAATAAQPSGHTLSTSQVRTQVPFLLKHALREYQHIGLDWLVTIYRKRINGILADEMGLGKTIQTIALLAWLVAEEGVWGPHLIVVPTSVMLNWEMEFKKWCPAFKLLTYYGSAKERKAKRQGWSKPNAFHVCITSYTLILQDAKMFRRKKWKYLILDEAHMIKNWKSLRWQTLLNFNSKRRLLLTGTPLQNDLMELWSLMHFLMPHVFASHAQFKDWFSSPLTGMVQGQEEVNK